MNYKILIAFLLFIIEFTSCKKSETLIPNQSIAHFLNQTSGTYFIQNDPNSVYDVTIGSPTVSDKDRTVNFTISTSSGAVAGTQYTLANTGSTVIPAGKSTAVIPVKGIFAGYSASRKDSLRFTITGGDAIPADYNKTFDLVLQKYCSVSLASFTGTYIAQDYIAGTGAPDGGPYTLTITPGTTTGSSGTISISGLWAIANPFIVNMNWSNPANFTTTIPDQNWFIHTTYGQAKIKPAGTGTFSSCDNTLLLRYEAYVSAGSFGQFYTTLRK